MLYLMLKTFAGPDLGWLAAGRKGVSEETFWHLFKWLLIILAIAIAAAFFVMLVIPGGYKWSCVFGSGFIQFVQALFGVSATQIC